MPRRTLSIRYGHTRTAAADLTISLQLAEELLLQDIHLAEIAVNTTGLILNQNQYDALVSFAFNFG